MKRLAVLLLFVVALRLHAADIEAGIAHFQFSPRGENTAVDGGELDIASSRGFAATAEVFWTPQISTQFAATFMNPAVALLPGSAAPGDVDLGTLGIDAYSLSARWHFTPQARFSPYAGAGVALATFGNLDDQFGPDIEVQFENETTLLAETGLRYRARPNVFVTLGVTYMPLEATPNFVRNDSPMALPETVQIDPLIVSIGASWRF